MHMLTCSAPEGCAGPKSWLLGAESARRLAKHPRGGTRGPKRRRGVRGSKGGRRRPKGALAKHSTRACVSQLMV